MKILTLFMLKETNKKNFVSYFIEMRT